MTYSTLPDGMPILSRGRHRNPKHGACFMELASLLAGERWSDHPPCTHPLLAQLAQQVNDSTSDDGRQELLPHIPSVVGRRGDENTYLTVSVAAAASAVLDVPEATQRVLAAGLLQGEQLCADLGPGFDATRCEARRALEQVPLAVAWVERLGIRRRITMKTFARQCAPTLVRCTVEGIVMSGRTDLDRRLRALLEVAIAACPFPEPATSAVTEVSRPA